MINVAYPTAPYFTLLTALKIKKNLFFQLDMYVANKAKV
jgi:hypothetical protein